MSPSDRKKIDNETGYDSKGDAKGDASNDSSHSSHSSETKRHLRGSSLLLFGRFISLGVNLGTQVLLVRLLTESDFGSFAYMLSVLLLGGNFARLGMDKALARFVPMYVEKKEWNSMAGTVVLVAATTVVLGLLIAIGGLLFGKTAMHWIVDDPDAFSMFLWMVVLVPVEALEAVLTKLFAIFARPKSLFFRRHVLGPILKLSAVLPLLFFTHNVAVLVGCYVAARLIGTSYSLMLLLSVLRKKELLHYFTSEKLNLPVRDVLGFSFPLLATDVASVLRTSFVTFLLGVFHGPVGIAAFRTVLPVARLNLVVSDSFQLLYSPAVAKLFARDDRRGIEKLYWDNVAWIALATAPMFLVSFSLAHPVTTFFFGERYSDSGVILCCLSLGWYINAIFGFNSLTLRMHGHVKPIVMNDLFSSFVAIGFTFALIPKWGALGGALAMTLTLVVQNLVNQWSLIRLRIVPHTPWYCIKLYLWVAVVSSALLVFQQWSECSLLVGLFLAVLGFGLVAIANFRALKIGDAFPELKRIIPIRTSSKLLKKS